MDVHVRTEITRAEAIRRSERLRQRAAEVSFVPKLTPPKTAKGGSRLAQENADGNRLGKALKAAAKDAPKRESWWADANLSREEFQRRVEARHRQILNSASDGTRSMTKVT